MDGNLSEDCDKQQNDHEDGLRDGVEFALVTLVDKEEDGKAELLDVQAND